MAFSEAFQQMVSTMSSHHTVITYIDDCSLKILFVISDLFMVKTKFNKTEQGHFGKMTLLTLFQSDVT